MEKLCNHFSKQNPPPSPFWKLMKGALYKEDKHPSVKRICEAFNVPVDLFDSNDLLEVGETYETEVENNTSGEMERSFFEVTRIPNEHHNGKIKWLYTTEQVVSYMAEEDVEDYTLAPKRSCASVQVYESNFEQEIDESWVTKLPFMKNVTFDLTLFFPARGSSALSHMIHVCGHLDIDKNVLNLYSGMDGHIQRQYERIMHELLSCGTVYSPICSRTGAWIDAIKHMPEWRFNEISETAPCAACGFTKTLVFELKPTETSKHTFKLGQNCFKKLHMAFMLKTTRPITVDLLGEASEALH